MTRLTQVRGNSFNNIALSITVGSGFKAHCDVRMPHLGMRIVRTLAVIERTSDEWCKEYKKNAKA